MSRPFGASAPPQRGGASATRQRGGAHALSRVRRIAQVALAVVAVLAAAGAALRYLGDRGEFFGERLETIPSSGPVGIRPVLTPHGFSGTEPLNIYMCVGVTSDIGDCVKLGKTTPALAIHSVPIPDRFPDGTDIAPGTYVIRVGPDAQGQYPPRGSFQIVPFRVGHKRPVITGFDTAAPGALELGPAKEIARGAPCAPPVWLADGRLVVGSTVVDVHTGVTISFPLTAAEIAWSPVGDKLAYITSDRKELRLAGPDGADAVAKVREARGLLSSLTWSPDGARLAFIAQSDPTVIFGGGPGPPTVNILDATKGTRTQAGPGLAVSWSSDENVLAVERAGNRIEASSPDGVRRPLTSGFRPAWGPDGKLVVIRGANPNEQGFIVSSDGKQAALASSGNTCGMSFSPDGSLLAIVRSPPGAATRVVLREVKAPGAP
jgi:hypothetical protein